MRKSGCYGSVCGKSSTEQTNKSLIIQKYHVQACFIALLYLTQRTKGFQDTAAMQIRSPFITAAVLGTALVLTACGKPETITAGESDPDAAALNAASPVELPPMVTQSRTYRCKDASLVYVDFFSNNTATYKASKEDAGTKLTAAEPGKPYSAGGYSVSGDGPQVEITAPGKPAQSCKA